MSSLAGKRVVVVGASAGIGRSMAVAAVRGGAQVVMSARRADALAEAVAEAGGGTAVAADVCAAEGPDQLVAGAVAELGEIDLLVYTVGFADLRRLVDTDAATWHRTLDANVVGFNQLVRAALPHLADDAVVAVLSSETSGAPRLGLVPYAASKAALEASLRGWRAEQSGTRFTCVIVGATQPSDFGTAFEAEELERAFESWMRHGLLQERFMHTDDLATVLVDTLATTLAIPGVGIEEMVLRSPSPVAGPVWNPQSAAGEPAPG
jgi:NAD(P)-dependent dehydrogenase (short-subunit alcohol dehydrogenase family)